MEVFLLEERKIPGAHEIGAAILTLELRANVFTDVRLFREMVNRQISFQPGFGAYIPEQSLVGKIRVGIFYLRLVFFAYGFLLTSIVLRV